MNLRICPALVLLTLLSPGFGLLLPADSAWAADTRPNVLLILADDQGWGDLSVTGNVNLRTPNIDSLARDGARLDHFYVCPVCSPTRAEMLTGRYNTRLGVTSTSTGGERLNQDEKTLADTFRSAGYATAAFGKWHNGTQWPYHPNARGFDEFYGFTSGHWGHYFSPSLEHNDQLVRGRGYITDDVTDHALDFMEQHRDRPFFCYLAYNTPHSPMQVPDRFWERFDGVDLTFRHREPEKEDLQHTRAALAMCENIDWNVGRLLKHINDLGMAGHTIVLYLSDNGPNGWRWNDGLKGRKGSTDEGGVRSPCFIRWPGTVEPGTRIPQLAGAVDLLPTLADLAGIPVVGDRKLDGVSIKPLLLDPTAPWPERLYFNAWKGRVSVRASRYRLDHQGHLFDMEADPGQRQDVAGQHPALTVRLKQAVADWKRDTATTSPPRPFTVGHPGSRTTLLPARDGTAHHTIQRSSIHPNCSFFTNWKDPNDMITWDIEVLTAGVYAAEIYYTCKEEDVGAQLELSFGSSRTRGRIAEAYDPPLVGAADDRSPRSESLVKDFKPMTVGTLRLPGAIGRLTLRATGIPGRQAIDLRYVTLTRVGP